MEINDIQNLIASKTAVLVYFYNMPVRLAKY